VSIVDQLGFSDSDLDNTDNSKHNCDCASSLDFRKTPCRKRQSKIHRCTMDVILGTIIGGFFQYVFSGLIASIIVLLIWLALVKHFFDTGWLRALVIAVVAIIIWLIIAVIIGVILGLAIIGGGLLF
jgi:membrane-bound ClpP family serine protease